MDNRPETRALLPNPNRYTAQEINSSEEEEDWTDSCSSSYSESGR